MQNFNKFDNVIFELGKKESPKDKFDFKKYSYIWDYDEIDPLILEIMQNGKKINDKEISWKNKKLSYLLKIISIKKVNSKVKELIEKTQSLENETKSIENKLKLQEESINNLNAQIDMLQNKAIEEANLFKQEVLNIQKKAQETINEHKQKTTQHQEQQAEEIKMYALQSLLEKLIQPLNNFEIAITVAQKIDNDVLKNFITGFNMLYKQVEDILIEIGLTKIIPQVGDVFDANFHQAYELVNSDFEKDTILEIKNIGYKLHDRVIKPALVVVAK
ncbi:nucleotide exchange factor GrpE [Metamycoplasma alkalescens]|uniref:Protein GrpE n=1 Tax=Metamycoplasma alkalescens TaxID=45363 RepID=A0A318U657_9BACT|nr:nucleotide exchange factor GrpE [Metamycoplasma alkalescens]PYF43745.1 molecular chaperone GrpE [Metamycoplasma alkalescens]